MLLDVKQLKTQQTLDLATWISEVFFLRAVSVKERPGGSHIEFD